ncbi:MAG: redoxin domain-containing protein [Nitrospirota bacterium]
MKRRTLSLLIVGFAVLVGSLNLGLKKQPDNEYLNQMAGMMKAPVNWQGKFAPDFEIDTIDGKKFKLSDHIGKEIIVLNFFATWCGPCKEEIPELNRFFGQYQNKRVILLGVNASEKPDVVGSFVKKESMQFPVGIDSSDSVQRKFGVSAFPTTVFIGVDGKVQLYEMGPIMNSEIAFKKLVDTNLEAIRSGTAISLEDYEKGATRENYKNIAGGNEKEGLALSGRAKDIAAKMNCPCGCSDKVLDCNCKTAKDIKKKLKENNFGNKADVQIIKELDAEFCVKEK